MRRRPPAYCYIIYFAAVVLPTDGNGTFAICLNSKWQSRPDHETLERSLTGDQFRKTAGGAQVRHDGRERLNAIPAVEASAFTCRLPLEGGYGLPFNIIARAPEGINEDE